MNDPKGILDEVAKVWIEAKKIIAEAMHEYVPSITVEMSDHFASATIARLAQANILLEKVQG